MKKFGLLALALAIGVAMMSAPTLASNNFVAAYQQQQPPPLEPQEAADLYGLYYKEPDQAKKYELAKQFLEKYPNVNPYWQNGPQKFMARYELGLVYNKCQEADKAFFGSPSEANLNSFLAACDPWIAKAPKPDPFYSTRMALGTGYGVLAGFYKDTDRGWKYTDKALPLLNSTAVPEGWKPADWEAFRKENIGRLIQYQGLYKLRQSTPDFDAAAKYLSDSASHKEGPAYKDPNTYLLRAEAVTNEYTKLNAEYNALTDDEKRGDKGKAVLEKINPVVSRLANDYARVVALTESDARFKAIYDDAKSQCEAFYKFLKNGKTDGIDELYKRFKTDVGVPDLEIKAEATTAPKTTPVGGKGAKAAATGSAGGSATAPAASGEKATTTTTTKPAASKAPVKKKG